MVFNRFILYVVFQIVLIVFTSLGFTYTFFVDYMLITRYSLFFLLILQVYILLYYINRISRNLTRFFEAFNFEDHKPVFSTRGKFREFSELHQAFDRIIKQFETIRIEKEKEYQFFFSAIQHVGVGLAGFDDGGKILLANKALLNLFGLERIGSVKELSKFKQDFDEILFAMNPAQTELVSIILGDETLYLSLKASVMKIEERTIRLVSFQDIRPEIEQKEIDAWQRITRIINHEIINSLSPVNLLSSTLLRSIEDGGSIISREQLDRDILENLYTGLKAINLRSQGLTQFVENYRRAMQLPEPSFEVIPVSNMLESIRILFSEELTKRKIDLKTSASIEGMTIYADRKMIEQVIVNLIKNSLDALELITKPIIKISAIIENEKKIIEIADNGKGIPGEILDNIFIPYFSTKEGGSGIGLSLSREVMRLHKGEINVVSYAGEGSKFRMVFIS